VVAVAGFLHKLASFSRLILLDRLGSGLSDRGPSGQSFEDRGTRRLKGCR
jgi:hypothetical protein